MSNQLDEPVCIQVTFGNPNVALQLAQLCKRISFATCFEMTEAHLTKEERNERTYQMLAGMDAVASALAEKGVAPR